jgi:hypothetical protein
MVAMFRKMLEEDRLRAGWSVGQAAWRLGITVREYREMRLASAGRTGTRFTGSASCSAGRNVPFR